MKAKLLIGFVMAAGITGLIVWMSADRGAHAVTPAPQQPEGVAQVNPEVPAPAVTTPVVPAPNTTKPAEQPKPAPAVKTESAGRGSFQRVIETARAVEKDPKKTTPIAARAKTTPMTTPTISMAHAITIAENVGAGQAYKAEWTEKMLFRVDVRTPQGERKRVELDGNGTVRAIEGKKKDD